jgi:hypothetical protein
VSLLPLVSSLYSPSLLSMAEGGAKRKRIFEKNILLD